VSALALLATTYDPRVLGVLFATGILCLKGRVGAVLFIFNAIPAATFLYAITIVWVIRQAQYLPASFMPDEVPTLLDEDGHRVFLGLSCWVSNLISLHFLQLLVLIFICVPRSYVFLV
jgi:hypothetical protein